jgi:hypothetical protein
MARGERKVNNDINNTLQALVPILQMNGEKVQSIEAVKDWYTINGTEYMKEVAEITYTSGYRKYADIGCDANLTAVYDVMAVLQEIKPCSKCIGRIVRGVYEKPAAEPELKELSEWKADFKGYINALNIPKDDYDGIMEYIDEVPEAEQEAPDINVGHMDAISRQAAIEAVEKSMYENPHENDIHRGMHDHEHRHFLTILMGLPPVQPKRKRGKWIERESDTEDKENGFKTVIVCSCCDFPATTFYSEDCESRTQIRTDFCPNCGADMRGEKK